MKKLIDSIGYGVTQTQAARFVSGIRQGNAKVTKDIKCTALTNVQRTASIYLHVRPISN